jgi:quercetin dioxygenase-like cupin family protein
VLAGKGVARSDRGETEIIADTAVLVMPNDVHQFINTGKESLIFLCIIPNLVQ